MRLLDYGFAEYTELLRQQEGKDIPLPGMEGRRIPQHNEFITEASLETLDEVVRDCGFKPNLENEVLRFYDGYDELVRGIMFFWGSRFSNYLLLTQEGRSYHDKKPDDGMYVQHNSAVKFQTRGRRNDGKLRVVADLTRKMMLDLNERRIPAVWILETRVHLPFAVSNQKDLQSE